MFLPPGYSSSSLTGVFPRHAPGCRRAPPLMVDVPSSGRFLEMIRRMRVARLDTANTLFLSYEVVFRPAVRCILPRGTMGLRHGPAAAGRPYCFLATVRGTHSPRLWQKRIQGWQCRKRTTWPCQRDPSCPERMRAGSQTIHQ
jgi:hypothetical protein